MHIGTKELETKRLNLRKMKDSDADTMFKMWASDNEVTKYMTWHTHQDKSETEEILKRWVSFYSDIKFYHWGIELKEEKLLIGSISSVIFEENTKTVEVGYCISRKYWNQGLTSEALRRIIEYFFDSVGVNVVRATFDTRNIASRKVMEKCGMTFEGVKRLAAATSSGIGDLGMCSITRLEYLGGHHGKDN